MFSNPLRSKVNIVAISALTTMSSGYVVKTLYNDEGTRRSGKFWFNIVPMYLNYRYVQFLNSDLKAISDEYASKWYENLHEQYTDRVKELTYDMKGFYLKHAQLMSIQDDFVPSQYMKWLKDTQSNVPSQFTNAEAKAYVAKLCEEELNLNFDNLFQSWEETPLGVASIGQVHKAVLRDGRQVAVKFLCPGIEQKFRSDIKTLKKFCELAMPQHVSAFNEIEKQFLTEFDYRNEAKALNTARCNTLPTWKLKVNIPEAYTELCSKNLLVMEYLDGIKLVDGIKQEFTLLATLSGKSLDEMEQQRKEAIANGTFIYQTLEEDQWNTFKTSWFLFLNDLISISNMTSLLHNYGPTRLIWPKKEMVWTHTPISLGSTIQLLCEIQADNIFNHGCFNGDQHPGNIMLLKDKRLGLIDYGQFKYINLENRIIFAKLIIAISRDDKDEIVRIYFNEMKTKTKYSNPDIAYRLACFWVDRDTVDIMGENNNIATFIDYCQEQDPMIQMAEEFLIACRASVMLRGMGNAFGLNLRISKLWCQSAEKFLKSQNIEY